MYSLNVATASQSLYLSAKRLYLLFNEKKNVTSINLINTRAEKYKEK